MKAITVTQPWAWAIAHAGKRVENRTRVTHHRGPLAIHAGAGWSTRGQYDPRIAAAWGRLTGDDDGYPPAYDPRIVYGAVLAVADLTDCHIDTWDGCCRPWGESEYRAQRPARTRINLWHLVLADVRPLPAPVPVRGRLGLWDLPADVTAAVREQL